MLLLVASERCRKPLNKFNLTASNMQLKRGMQHAALWQGEVENAWHFICLRETKTLAKQFSAMTINCELENQWRERREGGRGRGEATFGQGLL